MLFLSAARKIAFSIQEKPLVNGTLKQTIVFVVFAVAIPVVLSVIATIVTSQVPSSKKTMDLVNAIVAFLVCPLVGLIVQALMGVRRFFATGQFFFYLYFLLPGICSLLGVGSGTSEWLYPAIQLTLLLFAFVFVASLRSTLVYLLRWRTLLVIAVAAAVIYGLTFAMNVAGTHAVQGVSDNEASLNKQPFGVLFFAGVIAAPFVEEYVIRRTILVTFDRGLIGTLVGSGVACFYFAFLHIQGTNDWEHLVVYLLPSVVLTAGTALLRNAMPSALGHLLNNLTALLAG